ncbi:CDP-glycerol glycerophosphotransferase family protein [Brevibacterium sp. BDJS002]|uniref:CDP-glycerol glycerophosphotransferase family protein n=1 Tax=Brevibacterium sp. BDJS002 TaxID=3020906 RepID=UPI002307D458|nr:CDP-glycerol glycerophosphotransferase family protein [Brevibacterium sp. BDJS002]WCE39371.1 CDP-glycerol glycerophosphotransferase family protein [Brevibacterium sp. BDJS002]
MTTLPDDLSHQAIKGVNFAQSAAKLGARKFRDRIQESRLPSEFYPQATDEFVAAAYFGVGMDSVYQLEQWIWPFEQLEADLKSLGFGDYPFGIIVRSPIVAKHLSKVTHLPVRFSRLTRGLDDFMTSSSLRAVFYVNQGTPNFQALRYPGPAHVHLSHGESEKISMISNQLKAYDYVFTAGEAARDRIERTLFGMEVENMLDVGRPQLDRPRSIPDVWREFDATAADGRVVFFAPTWEGDSEAMAYGSLVHNGEAVVTSLLDAGYRVIFRPHPRTGVMNHDFAKALEAIEDIIDSDPRALLDRTPDVSWQFDIADVAVAEVSSVAYDWLSSKKPLVMVEPHNPGAEVLAGGLLDSCPRLRPEGGDDIVDLIAQAEAQNDAAARLSDHYLGDTAPGAQIARYVESSKIVIERRTEERRLKLEA